MELTLSDFIKILGHLGLDAIDLHVDDDSAAIAAAVNYAGFHRMNVMYESTEVSTLIFGVLGAIRDDLLALADHEALKQESASDILTTVAILDELLNGPSTGSDPSPQALSLLAEESE